ncbi:acyl-CoA dehydrogenase family protein [Euzebya tangerina]|uniref:acyl-CoA dehydrogenase family protein n=1 Tax=Euzebya tangerina TaxID=591198 RepID=UPI000E31657B|nr:acyl-CoA dehydrogenase family protein [Euzebya tangerina]
MYFDFTDDAKDLAAGAREFLTGEYSPSYVRSVWDSDEPRDPAKWQQLAETGFVGVAIAEEHGGLGMGDVEMALLLEEAGRANLTEPLLETAAVAAPTLADYAPEAMQKEWLPLVAAGEAIIAVKLGDAPAVADADVAAALLVETDGALHLVPADGVSAKPTGSIDLSRRMFTVEVTTGPDTLVTDDADAIARTFDRGAVATAAWLNGIGQQVLEMSVAYVKEREQFGRPVGSFQAVKHLLAETVLDVETSRAATWYAAYAVQHDLEDRVEAASVAKAFASDAERLANTNSLQAHGGIGFTWEHDLHLWLKRGKALEGAFGTASFHRERVAQIILD